MLSSITPLGERGRSQRWGVTTTAFTLAATVAGAAGGALVALPLAALLAVTGARVPTPLAAVVLTGLLLAGVVVEARGARLPTLRRQVDEDWLGRYRGWVYGAGFGAQLGAGVATTVTTVAVHLTVAVAALSGSPAVGALVGGVFGLARALPVLAGRRLTTPARLTAAHRRITGWAATARVTASAGLAALAGLTGVAGLTSVGAL